jgi:hypothetical protein
MSLKLLQNLRDDTGCKHDLRFIEDTRSGGRQLIHDYNAVHFISDFEIERATIEDLEFYAFRNFIKECHESKTSSL